MNNQAEIENDTIAAIASGLGGGVGVIRLSGPFALPIAKKLCFVENKNSFEIEPRKATYVSFFSNTKELIDKGLILYFPNPHSFTGEDVIEIHGHGSRFLLQEILDALFCLGARLARPGEFSERAFLNNKIDLIQAEAIADLIESQNKTAAFSAVKSLSGEFSKEISRLDSLIVDLRVLVEAEIDFPDEEINIKIKEEVLKKLPLIKNKITDILNVARQGLILKDGVNVAILGKPNVGKSSLLNNFSKDEVAIVSSVAGTTRDLLKKDIMLGGLPINIIDTAGLRDTVDEIENEGIKRAANVSKNANLILMVQDVNDSEAIRESSKTGFEKLISLLKKYSIEPKSKIIIVNNKIDILDIKPDHVVGDDFSIFNVSVKKNIGLEVLKQHIRALFLSDLGEGVFSARERHINCLKNCLNHLSAAKNNFSNQGAMELVAEDLRLAQNALGDITGQVTSDDILGEIFSTFCIGK